MARELAELEAQEKALAAEELAAAAAEAAAAAAAVSSSAGALASKRTIYSTSSAARDAEEMKALQKEMEVLEQQEAALLAADGDVYPDDDDATTVAGRDVDAAMELAWCQSKTTHQGDEAADCARLLAFLCATAISTGAGKAALDALASFPAKLYATQCLAHAMQEERHAENEGLDLSGRDWRWRGAEYRYHAARIAAELRSAAVSGSGSRIARNSARLTLR